jgi:hypothetical protein
MESKVLNSLLCTGFPAAICRGLWFGLTKFKHHPTSTPGKGKVLKGILSLLLL